MVCSFSSSLVKIVSLWRGSKIAEIEEDSERCNSQYFSNFCKMAAATCFFDCELVLIRFFNEVNIPRKDNQRSPCDGDDVVDNKFVAIYIGFKIDSNSYY